MKKSFLTTLCLLPIMGFAQPIIPYFQQFDDASFYAEDGMSLAGVVNAADQCDNSNPAAAKGYSWDIEADPAGGHGKVLRLTAHPWDNAQMECSTYVKSRAEAVLTSPINGNRNTTFISYKIYIPDDSTFTEIDSTGGYIISQILSTAEDINGNSVSSSQAAARKLLTMQLVHDTSLGSNGRKLAFRIYDNEVANQLAARATLEHALTKGAWHEIIFEFHWSELSSSTSTDYGTFSMYIDRYPVILSQETTTGGLPLYHLEVSTNANDPAYGVEFPNVVMTNESTPRAVGNAFKFGHYRTKPYSINHTLYFDNLQNTSEFPQEYNRTKLHPEYCDTELPIEDLTFTYYPVANATHYIIKLEKDGVTDYIGNGGNLSRDLSTSSFVEPGETYNIQVRAERIEDTVQVFSYGYGEVCQVTIPKHTFVIDEDCDVQRSSLDVIEAYPVKDANTYTWRIDNGGVVTYKGTGSSNTLDLSTVSGVDLVNGDILDIQVRARKIVNGVEEFSFNYDKACEYSLIIPARPNTENHIPSITDSQLQLSIFPNPSHGDFTVKSELALMNIQILNGLGQTLWNEEINGKKEWQIQLPNQLKGLFWIKAQTSDNQYLIKKIQLQ